MCPLHLHSIPVGCVVFSCQHVHFISNVIDILVAGECILRVWQHSSVLQPCKCPICRRAITLLIPSEISEERQQDPEVERIMRDVAKYNRIFGGGPVSFMQVLNSPKGLITYFLFRFILLLLYL